MFCGDGGGGGGDGKGLAAQGPPFAMPHWPGDGFCELGSPLLSLQVHLHSDVLSCGEQDLYGGAMGVAEEAVSVSLVRSLQCNTGSVAASENKTSPSSHYCSTYIPTCLVVVNRGYMVVVTVVVAARLV